MHILISVHISRQNPFLRLLIPESIDVAPTRDEIEDGSVVKITISTDRSLITWKQTSRQHLGKTRRPSAGLID
jgi:hypothetical protein